LTNPVVFVLLTFLPLVRFLNYSFPVHASCYLDPEGKVIEAIWNEGTKHPQVKYYYSSAQECMTNSLYLSMLNFDLKFVLFKVLCEKPVSIRE